MDRETDTAEFRNLFKATDYLTNAPEGAVPVYWAVLFADEVEGGVVHGFSEIELGAPHSLTDEPFALGKILGQRLDHRHRRMFDGLAAFNYALGLLAGYLIFGT